MKNNGRVLNAPRGSAQTRKVDRFERAAPKSGQFGEFDETGIGTDLTIEWESNDPDLHAHTIPGRQLDDGDEEDRYRHFYEAGLPDA